MILLKKELQRAIGNRKFFVAVSIGVIIASVQYITTVIPAIGYLDLYKFDSGLIPHSVFNQWFGSVASGCLILYYIIVPILTAFPHADSFYFDKSSGYAKNILTRSKKSNYLQAKFFSVFLSGGLIAVISPVINLFATMMVMPSITPLAAFGIYPVEATNSLGDIFYTNPYLYLIIMFVLNFIGFGAFSVTALPASFIFNNRFMVCLTPFMIYYLLSSIMDLLDYPQYSPMNFLRFDQPTRGVSLPVSIVFVMVIAVVSYLIFNVLGQKDEFL